MPPGPELDPAPAGRRIATPRLLLEPIGLSEAAAVLAGRALHGLPAAPGWPTADTFDALAMDLAADRPDGTGWWITRRSLGDIIGDCGWRGGPDAGGTAEIGYGLAGPHRGQGYGREAVAALVGWCLGRPGVRRLAARVLPSNTPSRRVLEGLGFRPAGTDGEHLVYLLAARPAARR